MNVFDIGDEYAERTGRQRINYTRQEIQAGTNWAFTDHWQTYFEAGYAYSMRNPELQKPWRVQWGLQFESEKNLWQDKLGWYTALDIESMEQRDWNIDRTFQIGFVYVQDERRWRFGIEHYDGRAQLGEFFLDDERYISIGAWLDI